MYRPPSTVLEVPTSVELVAAMDRTVAGLEKIKQRVALTLRRHLVAAVLDRHERPPNMILLGQSGGGKTHLLRAALAACPLISTEVNATEYSDTGYVGRDLVSMYTGLVGPQWRGRRGGEEKPIAKREMVALAERYSVVIIDEWDKLRGTGQRNERQVGRALQAELLKMSEGTDVFVKSDEHDAYGFQFRTHGVLHIAVGAFQGLNGVVADRRELHPDDPQVRTAYQEATVPDLVAYGFLEELVGRFSTIVPLPLLDNSAMTAILDEQLIPRYVRQLADEGVELEVTTGGLHALAGAATQSPIGARALVPKLEKVLHDAWYRAKPGDRIVVNGEHVSRETAELLPAVNVA